MLMSATTHAPLSLQAIVECRNELEDGKTLVGLSNSYMSAVGPKRSNVTNILFALGRTAGKKPQSDDGGGGGGGDDGGGGGGDDDDDFDYDGIPSLD